MWYHGVMKIVPSPEEPYGYVLLHGRMADVSTDPEAVEVVVSEDGLPFSTYMEAIVYARVMCPLEWQVLAVRTTSSLIRPSVLPSDRRAG